MRDLARYLLENRLRLPPDNWTTQGFGFLRLKISDSMRLHVWDKRLRATGVSDMHDHAQWAFTSKILSGEIINTRYTMCESTTPGSMFYNMATITCGIGGGMNTGVPAPVFLVAGQPELYTPGCEYRQAPDEIHRTYASDGAVTIIRQERRDTDTARVFWPEGGSWGDAIPRQAALGEVDEVGAYALAVFGK